jgi:hypothetical protein
MRKRLGIIGLAMMAAVGCLQKETGHTLYLSPDGMVSWLVIEKDVYSDTKDRAARSQEEQEYIVSAAGDAHGIGRALLLLDPLDLRTRIIRNERPFVVTTEARYLSVERLGRDLMARLGLDGDVILHREGPVLTLRIRLDVAAALALEQEREPENPVDVLVDDLDRYRIVLTEGRFTSARGFTLSTDGTQAVFVKTPWEEIEANGGIAELTLAWPR